MASTNSLKISYKGLTRNIVCDPSKYCYEDIVNTAMEKFNIRPQYEKAIELYDEHANKYNKDTFEYFLILFPNPHKIFFIRFDASKIVHIASNDQSQRLYNTDDRIAFGVSKLNNKLKTESSTTTVNTNCDAVPVRRQNCFLGQFPNNNTTTSDLPSRNNRQNMTREFVKRMRLLKQSPPKRKNIAVPTVQKRTMRI